MGTVGSRGRRTALSVLLGSAMAVLLAVTTAGAASGSQPQGAPGAARAKESGGGIHYRSDVFMRDDLFDTGIEPSVGTAYASPDIKVCRFSTECVTSEDPIAGGTNWVFVKLHRPGPLEGSSSAYGKLELYFAHPGAGLAWPSSWTKIGEEWRNIPYGTTTVRFTWTGAPGPGHVPLLARWDSSTDPMTYPETAFTLLNVLNNNNITIRSVYTVSLQLQIPDLKKYTLPHNFPLSASTSIAVTQPSGPSFRDVGGQVTVDLGQPLFERWRQGGLVGTNVRHLGGTQVEILDPANASLDNIVLHPGERFTIDIRFFARVASAETYLVKLALWGPVAPNEKPIDLGGVLYEITVSDREGARVV